MLNFELVKILKPLFTFVLLVTFLGSTMGVNVYKHYCGDFLKGFSLYVQASSCMDESAEEGCESKSKMDCCDDETDFYQLDVEYIKNNRSEVQVTPTFLVSFILSTPDFSEQLNQIDNNNKRPPPLIKRIPLYKKFKQLVLYA